MIWAKSVNRSTSSEIYKFLVKNLEYKRTTYSSNHCFKILIARTIRNVHKKFYFMLKSEGKLAQLRSPPTDITNLCGMIAQSKTWLLKTS